MDLDLTDRVYVITGGGSGLGRATAEQLLADGARVVVSGRSEESTSALVAAQGGRAVVSRPTTRTRPLRDA